MNIEKQRSKEVIVLYAVTFIVVSDNLNSSLGRLATFSISRGATAEAFNSPFIGYFRTLLWNFAGEGHELWIGTLESNHVHYKSTYSLHFE